MDQAKIQGYQDLLLKFEGRIGPNTLWRGAIIVLAAALLLDLLGAIVPFLRPILWVFNLALLYPLFCIYTKRFHDAGKPAVWTLAVLAGVWLGAIVLGMLFAPMFWSGAVAAVRTGNMYAYSFQLAILNMVIAAVLHLGAAFVVNRFLTADPGPNAYGEPVADAPSPNPLA